jgi:hypothetical protein
LENVTNIAMDNKGRTIENGELKMDKMNIMI